MKYKIEGGQLPVVTIELEPGETIITEAGGMSWMTSNIELETKGGGVSKVLGRMFSGESLFLNYYTAKKQDGSISLSSSLPGSIIPIQITKEKPFIMQKGAFLGAESSVELSIHFRKKFGTGFFGGEGFIMQKLTGEGTAFLEIDGSCIEKELEPGEKLVVSTGYVAAMDSTVSMELVSVGGIKNSLLGGEGFFNTVLTGPGKVYLQTMPAFRLTNLFVK
ncbi:conserved hypothetical protein (DUF124) [Alteracholeplasma palmae J233]|uniref:TIGR00266 family protein n=1 Tax=Alteracholeplasma palmae (strain ATCC 49389 / J233) TaxID=1318466 RepID=U4KM01_ALTPJ|nr:TIGR00266 family protein [Alteracholeplasma palmae]CCV65012.1 conserved hypothetical protein (DUF124) [Alteracholeplasma palmae J233]